METQGIEANVTIRPYESLSAQGFFTYLHSDIKNSDQPLRNRPRFSGGIVLENEFFERLVARMNLSAIGQKYDLQIPTTRRSTEAYVKADLALTFSPNRSRVSLAYWPILPTLNMRITLDSARRAQTSGSA